MASNALESSGETIFDTPYATESNTYEIRDENGTAAINNGFTVEDEFDADFQHCITSPDIVEKLRAMSEGKVGMVN